MKKFIVIIALLSAFGLVSPAVAWAAPGTSLSGTLTVTCTKAAGPGLWVVAKQGGVQVASVSASATGAYTFPDLAPGSYTISPAAPGGCGPVPRERTVSVADAPVTGVDFTVVNVADISGTVTGCPAAQGAPNKGVTMRLYSGNAVIGTTVTNAAGFYFFQWLPQQDGYAVEVVPAQGCGTKTPKRMVNLSAGDVSGVDFALTRSRCGGGSGSLDFGSLCLS